MTRTVRIGVQLHPQATDTTTLLDRARAIDEAGFDSLWTWDHFFPLHGDMAASHFECMTLVTAMAMVTTHVTVGPLVLSNTYRNPDLVADMARTLDHVSGGRAVLGLGAGWSEQDHVEYGYPFGSGPERLRGLAAALPRIRRRLDALVPGPVGRLPILIGGGGERVTLRLVAEHATMWNSFGPPAAYAHKSAVLDEWCVRAGRDPSEVERTVLIDAEDVGRLDEYVAVGAEHVIVGLAHPFDLTPALALLEAAEA